MFYVSSIAVSASGAVSRMYFKAFREIPESFNAAEIIDFNALNDAQCLKVFTKRCRGAEWSCCSSTAETVCRHWCAVATAGCGKRVRSSQSLKVARPAMVSCLLIKRCWKNWWRRMVISLCQNLPEHWKLPLALPRRRLPSGGFYASSVIHIKNRWLPPSGCAPM